MAKIAIKKPVKEEALVVSSIKEFAVANNFTQIAPKVRKNTNDYPFITFINADNVAENVYFSVNASEQVEEGMAVTKELLAKHQIAYTINADGEPRTKLISNSERVNIADLLG